MKRISLIVILLLGVISSPQPALSLDFAPGPSYLWGDPRLVVADDDIVTLGHAVGIRLYDNSTVSGFPALGQLALPDGVWDMAIAGPNLFVTSVSGSLNQIDRTDPTSPQNLGVIGAAPRHHLVEIEGHWMVTAGVGQLSLFALSDTSAPVLVDSCDCVGSPQLLAFADSLIVVLTTDLDLHALAITGGTLTGVLSTDSTSISSSAPNSFALYHSHLYVARGADGVMIIDYSDPAAPTPVAPFYTYGIAQDVCVGGDRLLIADQVLGLVSCRLYDPANPTWQGEYGGLGGIDRVWAGVNGRFFASQSTNIFVVDADILGRLSVVKSFANPGQYRNFVRSGETGFISDVFGLWRTVPDLIDADSSFQRAGLYGVISDMVMNNGRLYTAESFAGASVYDVSESGNLTRRTTVDVEGRANVVAVFGDRLVVVENSTGFEIFDISNLSAPEFLGRYRRTKSYLDAIMPSERYLYLSESNGGGVTVYDLQHPVKPRKLGLLPGAVSAADMLIRNGYLYVADSPSGLQVYSLANPSSPSLVATRAIYGGARTLWRSGRALYVGSQISGVQVYDIGDPLNPSLLGEIDLDFPVVDMAKFGERIWYISDAFIGSLDVLPPLLPGDIDNNGILEPVDLVLLIEYVFRNGQPLLRPNAADVNADGATNLVDVARLANAIYLNGGPLLPGTIE